MARGSSLANLDLPGFWASGSKKKTGRREGPKPWWPRGIAGSLPAVSSCVGQKETKAPASADSGAEKSPSWLGVALFEAFSEPTPKNK